MSRSLLPLIFLISTLTILPTQAARADARRFAFAYQSRVTPTGSAELEVWNTFRFSRDYYYRSLQTRAEFEYGVARNLVSAIYINHEAKAFEDALGSGNASLMSVATMSLSNEWKYKLMDPAADAFGFALYAEGTIGLDETEVEGKLIFDKQVGSMILALNLVIEHEWETEINEGIAETGRELKPGIDAGFAWFIGPAFSLGIEGRYMGVLEEGDLTHSAIFLGPSVSCSTDRFWFSFAFLPQVANLATAVDGTLDLIEFERYQARLIFSMEL